jgi:hypothetical protein
MGGGEKKKKVDRRRRKERMEYGAGLGLASVHSFQRWPKWS